MPEVKPWKWRRLQLNWKDFRKFVSGRGKKIKAVNLKCPLLCEIPVSTALFWPLNWSWLNSRDFSAGIWSWGFNQKRQDYVSGFSHRGAVPKVQGCGREGEKCGLQWHPDLDSGSWINHRTSARGDVDAVQGIQNSQKVLSGADRVLTIDCINNGRSYWPHILICPFEASSHHVSYLELDVTAFGWEGGGEEKQEVHKDYQSVTVQTSG